MQITNPDIPPQATLIGERAPTSSELSAWDRLLGEYKRAGDAIDACRLLFENVQTLQLFSSETGVSLPAIDPTWKQQFQEIVAAFGGLTRGIRGVEDHTLGVHFRYKLSPSGQSTFEDIDIVAASEDAAKEHGFGAVVVIILGIVVLAGAIATAVYCANKALELSQQLRTVVKSADKALCSDPTSPTCQKWKDDKAAANFDEKTTLADTITAGVKKVGFGLVAGVLALLAIGAFVKGRK